MEYLGAFREHTLTAPIYYLFDPTQRIYFPYLATSLLIAMVLTILESRREAAEKAAKGEQADPPVGALRKIFPKSVYTHRSAVADYFYFYSNAILYTFIMAPVLYIFGAVASRTYGLLVSTFGPVAIVGESSTLLSLAYSLLLVLAFDLALFLSHMLQHVFPFLWNFHKVHHSAEVLTPVSVYRMHPVDDLLSFIFTGVFSGIADAFFRYFVFRNVSMSVVGNVNLFLFVFYVASYHLRHSHIWFSYGPALSRIFISPAQHQIHHSKAKRHWDKNFGFIFAFWDWIFGSLYVPKKRERIEFGIGDGSEKEFSNFIMLYWIPFRDSFRLLRKSFKKK